MEHRPTTKVLERVVDEMLRAGPYAGFSEGGFEMENLVTENELSLQVDPS